MEKAASILAFLNVVGRVMIVGNANVEGKPLVTKLIDGVTNQPRTDQLGNEIGSIRVEQKIQSLNGSYLNSRNRVAFFSGTFIELEKLVAAHNLKEGTELPGQIVITESLEPMWKGQTPKINPSTEEVIGVKVGEKLFPVFMKMEYTEDMTKKDKLIRTVDDVNEWYGKMTALQANAPALAVANAPALETANIPQA